MEWEFAGMGILPQRVGGYWTLRFLPRGPQQEVVFHGRRRGGGFGGGGKGARGGGGNSFRAGDWTCRNCDQPGCWNARYACYRCGAPRYSDQVGGGQSTGAAQGMGGRYQGGVGSAMGGVRIVGPNGRDQTHTPGGDPTQRRVPQQGGANKNKVGGVPGGGVGGSMGGVGGNAWLEGRGGVLGGKGEGNPLPPGIVVSEAEQASQCMNFLRQFIPQDSLSTFEGFMRDHIPKMLAPVPVQTPTERQRSEQFTRLLVEEEKLRKKLHDGRERLEKAEAKIREDEASLEGVSRELEGIQQQLEAHRTEDIRRAWEARGARVEEVASDMDIEGRSETGEEVGVNIDAEKKRKVVRKTRSSTATGSLVLGPEESAQAVRRLSGQDKERCMNLLICEVEAGIRIQEGSADAAGSAEDKVEFNVRAAAAPTQGDVAHTPCG